MPWTPFGSAAGLRRRPALPPGPACKHEQNMKKNESTILQGLPASMINDQQIVKVHPGQQPACMKERPNSQQYMIKKESTTVQA
eukprot:1150286-Pelagomonas_calceolata.AAC.7